MASYVTHSSKLSQGIWENPCLSLFNHVSIDQFRRSKKVGDVHSLIDNHIGKRVFSIRGLISLNSYIEIPNPDANDESSREPINAAGPFVYIQYRRLPASLNTPIDKSIVMFHIDILTSSGPLRLSVSSMFDQIKMAGHALRIPLAPCSDGKWTMFALDIPKLLKNHVSRSTEYRLLKSVKLCASMVVRDVFTSHQAFTFTNVPQEMKLPSRSSDWEEEYSWTWCPEAPAETQLSCNSPLRIESSRHSLSSPSPTFKQPHSHIDHNNSTKLPLSQVVGVGCRSAGDLCWRGDRVLFPAAQSLLMYYSNSVQTLCCQHGSIITSLCFSNRGSLIISGEEEGVISLWEVDTSHCLWREKSSHLVTSNFSACDKFAIIVSKDVQQRVTVTLLDVHAARGRGGTSSKHSNTSLVTKLSGDFHVHRVLFMPTDSKRFVTCGADNLRYWRLNKGKLHGCSLIGDAGRGTEFTDMCFDQAGLRLFCATESGKLFLVDVSAQRVISVHQIHDSPISCVAIAGQCIVTGDRQGYLRAWSETDLSDYLVQARYESSILSLAVNEDAKRVVTATSHGCLGVLDLSSQKYTTLLQCHRSRVHAAAVEGTLVATCGADTTLRLIEEGVQLAEFHIDNDAPTAVAICPLISEVNGDRLVACGYASGAVRIVSASSSASLYEHNIQRSPILQLVFSRDGSILYALNEQHSLSLFDANSEFKLLGCHALKAGAYQIAANEERLVAVAACVKSDYSVTVYDEALTLTLFSLELPTKCKPMKVMFSSRRSVASASSSLLVLTSKSLLKYDMNLNSSADEAESLRPHVVFRMCSEDVTLAELSESGVVWLDPKTRRFIVRSANGGLFKLSHAPARVESVFLSPERVVALNHTGSLFLWERSMKSALLSESFGISNYTDKALQNDVIHETTSQSIVGELSFRSNNSLDGSMMIKSMPCKEEIAIDSSILKARRVLGYGGGKAKQNLIWSSEQGLVVYSVGHLLVSQSVMDPELQTVNTQSLNINTLHACGDRVLVGCVAACHLATSPSPLASFSVWEFSDGAPPSASLVSSSHLHDETGVEAFAVSSCQTFSISLGCWNNVLKCSVMIIWDKSFQMVSSHQMLSETTAVSFFPQSANDNLTVQFATVGLEGIYMWKFDMSGNESPPLQPIGHIASKGALSVSVINANFLMYGDARGFLNLWSFGEEKIVECCEVGQGVNQITSSKGHVFVSSICGVVKSFETSTGHLKLTSAQSFGCSVSSLAQESNVTGQACLVGTSDGALFVMSDKKHEEVLRIVGGCLHASHVKLIGEGEGRLLLTIDATDGSLRCWDIKLNRTVFHLSPPGSQSRCVACAVGGSFKSRMWCAVSCDRGLVRVFDLINVKLEYEFSLNSPVSHMCCLNQNLLCACADGSLVLVKLTKTHQMFQVGGAPGVIFRQLVNCDNHGLIYALITAPEGESHILFWDYENDGALSLRTDVMMLGKQIYDVVISPWDVDTLVVLTVSGEGSTLELHRQLNSSPRAKNEKASPPISIDLNYIVCSMVSCCGMIAVGTTEGEILLLNESLQVLSHCSPYMTASSSKSSSLNRVGLEASGSSLVSYNGAQIITWNLEQ